jgi:hypothetical protein
MVTGRLLLRLAADIVIGSRHGARVLIDKTVLKILYYVRAEMAQRLRIGETVKMRVNIQPNN